MIFKNPEGINPSGFFKCYISQAVLFVMSIELGLDKSDYWYKAIFRANSVL